MTTFGDLQIVASAKIGEATWRGRPALAEEEQGQDGLATGEPVLYHWPWYWHLPGLGPWLLLALAVALPRANRHRHALLIFIPMLVLGLLWPRVTKLTGMSSATETQFSFFIEFLAVGMALLWLNADRLGKYRGVMWFVMSLGVLLLADLAAVITYGRTFSGQSAMLLVFTAIISVVLLVSLALTRRLARRRYRPVRFMLWLAAWSTACSIGGVAAFLGVVMVVATYPIHDLLAVLVQIIVPGLMLSLCLYAVNLPYMLLMFSSPFFRRRFCAWLGVAVES